MSLATKLLINERNELVGLLEESNQSHINLYNASKKAGIRLNLGKMLRKKWELEEPILKAIHELDEALMLLEEPEEPKEAPLADWEKELLGL